LAEAAQVRGGRRRDVSAAALQETAYATFRRAVLAYRPSATITVDHLRPALEAAQIPPAAYGPYFRKALRDGLLTTEWTSVPSTWPGARGRRVAKYVRVAQNKAKEAA
jgi:hypothetical protein